MKNGIITAFTILVAAFLFIFLTLAYTNNLAKNSDYRTRASNPADTVTDSDALLNASENSLQNVDNEPQSEDADSGSDDRELEELNAL